MSTTTTIVILGGSYAGLGTAHRLLKHVAKTSSLKIILVAPNTHMFWNIASVRAIVPGAIAEEKVFQPILPGFAQYPKGQFELIQGTAESVDTEAKEVVVAGVSGQSMVKYDMLVLATGSRTTGDVPMKQKQSTQATIDALHSVQEGIKKASSITVSGAGATGVEMAGELGFEYGTQKKITLISSGAHVLEGTPPNVIKTATKQLQTLHVSIKLETRVVSFQKTPEGRTELSLSDGTKFITDLYLPAVGLSPNTSFLPQKWLNADGYVVVDEFLRVKGQSDIWAVGDLSAVQRSQYVNVEKQSTHVVKNIKLKLNGAEMAVYQTGGKDMLAVPVGRKAGTGHMGNMKLPSFVVNMVKGKTLFTEKMPSLINGSAF